MPILQSLDAYDLVSPLQPFDLPRTGQINTIKGLHTGAGSFIWKRYVDTHSQEALEYELDMLLYLSTAGLSFAVPAPVRTRDGALWVATEEGRVILTPLLPGRTLDPATYGMVDPAEVGLYGGAVGELQVALARYGTTQRPGHSLFNEMFSFPLPHINPFTVQPAQIGLVSDGTTGEQFAWWRAEAERLHHFVKGAYATLPQQLCHNDLSPANILVHESRVSAVLDFEFATVSARALDVAMGLRMSTRTWEDPEPWEIVRAFMRAYTRWMPFSEAEAAAMPDLMRLRTFLPTLWWLPRFGETQDSAIIVRGMGFLRRLDHWLKQYSAPFVDILIEFAD